MEFSVETTGKTTVVAVLANKLDAGIAKEFKTGITPLLETHNQIVLDLGSITFIDSSGLGAILSCLRLVTGRQGELKLCNLSKSARILFELVRMHKVFEIFNTREEAVASYVK